MAIDLGLLGAVQSGLRRAATMNYNSFSASEDVYEGFVLALFLEGALIEGWSYEWYDHAGPQAHLQFRLGPGRIFSSGFTHAQLDKPGRQPLEAHVGIRVKGRSGVAHEFDLAVLPKAAADAARAARRDPHFREIIIQAEAKFYTHSLPLHLGREIVGLSADCNLPRQGHLIANQRNSNVCAILKAHQLTSRYDITPRNGFGISWTRTAFARALARYA